MQIKILDHIIIGDNKYFSFADEGLIEKYKKFYILLTKRNLI
ncbi:MAG: JAB domain-containing protein [Candidatus Cloacimonadota bacterium]|nr:JAB domain-containing protein [Candidatus Cloacimonadota bacterium]